MSVPSISVVIPIYNTAQFLPCCLESMVGQLENGGLEVILVDDGSTDESGLICDKYAAEHPRIFKVVHKDNGGSASARQAGWNLASGKYITVCDSDDWVHERAYAKLLSTAIATESDVVICDYYCAYSNGELKPVRLGLDNNVSKEVLLKKSLSSNIFNSSWNKLFKRSLFSDNKLSWTNGINLGEDALMWSRILCLSNLKISYLPEPLYYYRRRYGEDTYTNRLTHDKWEQLKRVHEIRKELINEELLIDSACDVVFAGLRTDDLPKEQLRLFLKENLKLKHLISAKPKRLVALSVKIMGIDVAQFIIRKLYKFTYK